MHPSTIGVDVSSDDYLAGFALPSFYFHLTAAYAILRHNGVQNGKHDFLGAISVTPVS